MEEQFNTSNILKTFEGREPTKRMAADRRKLPAGVAPRYGWLSHKWVLLHLLQYWVMRSNVPTIFLVTLVEENPQNIQDVNKRRRDDSNTKYVDSLFVPLGESIITSGELQTQGLKFQISIKGK